MNLHTLTRSVPYSWVQVAEHGRYEAVGERQTKGRKSHQQIFMHQQEVKAHVLDNLLEFLEHDLNKERPQRAQNSSVSVQVVSLRRQNGDKDR